MRTWYYNILLASSEHEIVSESFKLCLSTLLATEL